jgi:hypothetical protein
MHGPCSTGPLGTCRDSGVHHPVSSATGSTATVATGLQAALLLLHAAGLVQGDVGGGPQWKQPPPAAAINRGQQPCCTVCSYHAFRMEEEEGFLYLYKEGSQPSAASPFALLGKCVQQVWSGGWQHEPEAVEGTGKRAGAPGM